MLAEWSQSHSVTVSCAAAMMIAAIAHADWLVPNTSVGYLYLIPILLSSAGLNSFEILVMALVCGWLREATDPLQGAVGSGAAGGGLVAALHCSGERLHHDRAHRRRIEPPAQISVGAPRQARAADKASQGCGTESAHADRDESAGDSDAR